jgi:metal-sulfur cluster biosynthetic enzyme
VSYIALGAFPENSSTPTMLRQVPVPAVPNPIVTMSLVLAFAIVDHCCTHAQLFGKPHAEEFSGFGIQVFSCESVMVRPRLDIELLAVVTFTTIRCPAVGVKGCDVTVVVQELDVPKVA